MGSESILRLHISPSRVSEDDRAVILAIANQAGACVAEFNQGICDPTHGTSPYNRLRIARDTLSKLKSAFAKRLEQVSPLL